MPPMKKRTVRFSSITTEMLKKLSDKYQVDEASIIRMAIAQLAEREGIVLSKRPKG
jgi:predicted transcriptional regulator